MTTPIAPTNGHQSYRAYLKERLDLGTPSSDEILNILLPLFHQVKETHDRGMVAPLAGLDSIQVTKGSCWFSDASRLRPKLNSSALSSIEHLESRAVVITGHTDIRDDEQGNRSIRNLEIGKRGEKITKPIFLPGYVSWEHEVEHHDQLTDIFCLGQLLASLACSLDFAEEDDLERYVSNRSNLFQINPRLHPVIGKAIVRMTEPRRRDRVQDLAALIDTLTHYRHQIVTPEADFKKISGFKEAAHSDRSKIIQQKLRDRLFELSRRNRLLFFRPTMQMLNLTVSSVPLMLDYKHISPDALCTWQGAFAEDISDGETVQLGKYLRFEDAPYLPGVLDQIRNQEARDRNEYGFSQLRMVIAFLRWNNLKENKEERISSPLVLVPVSLERKKGVRDSYTLTPLTTEAEVNPVLRYYLKQLYGLQLPEFIDLSQTSLQAFHEILQKQIQASEPGTTLRYMDKPQIKLVHERARARVELFRRRARLTGRGVRTQEGIDYSYSRDNFQPLGLQLFLKRVRPSPLPMQSVAGEPPKPRMPNIMPEKTEPEVGIREKDMYVLQSESDSNPYVWDFDLCSLTLGNFNYRKMSLVRDYNTLLESDTVNPAFDSIFSLQPRKADFKELQPLPPEQAYQIIASDPTQMAAITRARTGESYIIQGPPGTGKSQTITNLIADYVARGKRILFVCEKRAAIDVVFYRLKQKGLEKLCCLIHDSQSDKKAFIQDLKATYEGYLSAPDELKRIQDEREQVVKQLRFELDVLERFAVAMAHVDERDGITVRKIYGRLIELAKHLPQVSDADAEQLPGYSSWNRFGGSVQVLSRILKENGSDPIFARSAFRHLSNTAIQAERPLENITKTIDELAVPLPELTKVIGSSGAAAEYLRNIDDVFKLIQYAAQVKGLAEIGQSQLLNAQDPQVRVLSEAVENIRTLTGKKDKAAEKTTNWRERIPLQDLPTVLDQARKLEGSFLRFFMPSFWKLRGILNARYNFKAHVVAPAWTLILSDLKAAYDAEDGLAKAIESAQVAFKTKDLNGLLTLVQTLHKEEPNLIPAQRKLRELILARTLGVETITSIAQGQSWADSVIILLSKFMQGYRPMAVQQISAELENIRSALPVLPEILPVLNDLLSAPKELYRAVCERPWLPDQLEAGLLTSSLLRAYRRDRSLPRLDGKVLAQHVDRIKDLYERWMKLNGEYIQQHVHSKFLERTNLSNLPVAQLAPKDKDLKRVYTKGRRELEHEFSKVMRYRSIRDLADDETGTVVSDLKPIWLMSPLSVSDTLPLAGSNFDVVIFDEASQIPLEEAVPALYRGPQIIVVGDEMQLPPTDFFASKSQDEDEEITAETELEGIGYELNSDSFLTQSAENLPSTMLCWHYRSRSESLISFSNSAFYSRKLLTVPDVKLQAASNIIEAGSAEAGDENVSRLLDRPISFHYLSNGLYRDRRNYPEAAYISRIVRGVLKAKTGMSIGIVAFSEAQQGEIESALQELANQDGEFNELLQAEYEREENDQFCGLFVKNLENVQGDERDIVIMSICYGYDANKKMLMNFGPINKSGGEKRLNVVFSRAKRHMAIVSSIKSTAITNDYNEGANCLKRYLAYAEAQSTGQGELAKRVLSSFGLESNTKADGMVIDPLVHNVATALKEKGFKVDLAVGQSEFRCDLAVRHAKDEAYRLGILIDREQSQSKVNVLEQSIIQPFVLNSFGWKVVRILAKDWHHDRASVLAGIERELAVKD